MQIIPVIDLLNSQAVHARRGERGTYEPVRSVLTLLAADPLELAKAYRNKLGLETIYLADLDAILNSRPNWEIFARLAREGFRVWLDAGTQSAQRAVGLVEAGVETVVLGLESLTGPAQLAEIVEKSYLNRTRFVLSVDSRDGALLFPQNHEWTEDMTPQELVRLAWSLGLSRFLLLDLARVGSGRGAGGVAEVRAIQNEFPTAELWLGGGVRGREDVAYLRTLGVAGVLVATALHEGQLGKADT